VALCDKYEIAQFAASSRAVLGRARLGMGLVDEARALLREAVERTLAGSVRVAITRYISWLAEAHFQAGSDDEALDAIEEALRITPVEPFLVPETLRLRGEARARLGRLDDAERDLAAALRLAEEMGAIRLVTRAAASLAALRRRHGGDDPGSRHSEAAE
jgi:tetratricopeptide (TPR) repeat protein